MKSNDVAFLLNAVGPNGLKRAQANAFPDVWAMEIVRLGIHSRPYTFEGRPYLKALTRDPNTEIVFRKSAQMGATVTALIRTLHRIIEWEWNGLYLLPIKAGTGTFSQARIDTIIQSSALLKSYFAAVDNTNHKKTKAANLYIRGSNVWNDLREIPVDFEVWDERDRMVEEFLPTALARMDGSPHKHLFKLSTPITPEFGIDADFLESDQRFWYIKCPHCGIQMTLDWEDHVKIDTDDIDCKGTHLECDHCKKEITHKQMLQASHETGQWVSTEPLRGRIHGYHINQLYSPTIQLPSLGRQWMKGQEDDKFLRELFNSALGLGYIQKGEKLTEDILDKCRSDFSLRMDGYLEGIYERGLNIGIDVQGGGLHHVTGSYLTGDLKRRKVLIARMKWPDIYKFLRELRDNDRDFMCVIDAHPEKQMARELAGYFWGRVFVATYVESISSGELALWKIPKTRGEIGEVNINRTLGFDTSHSQFFRGQILLPSNIRELGGIERDTWGYNGWYKQMMTQVRQLIEDNNGNPKARYVKPGKKSNDHWDHADLYEMVASSLVVPVGGIQKAVEEQKDTVTPEDLGIPVEQFFGGNVEPVPFDGGSQFDEWENF